MSHLMKPYKPQIIWWCEISIELKMLFNVVTDWDTSVNDNKGHIYMWRCDLFVQNCKWCCVTDNVCQRLTTRMSRWRPAELTKGIIWRVSDLVERRVPPLSIDVPPVISQHFQAIFQLSLLITPTTTTKIDRGDGFVVSMCIIQWERSCQRKANVIILTITLLLSFPLVMMREKESQRSERWLKAIAE